jgi:hypothetical protein
LVITKRTGSVPSFPLVCSWCINSATAADNADHQPYEHSASFVSFPKRFKNTFVVAEISQYQLAQGQKLQVS